MTFIVFLWLSIWGGMFTGIYNLQSPSLNANFGSMFQGYRALLPIMALYICLMWILAKRSSFPFSRSPIGFLTWYFFVGLISSLFISPQKINSLYWAAEFIAPILVMWFVMDKEDASKVIKRILHLNYIVVILITISILPEAYRFGFNRVERNTLYKLPFKLGEIQANGIGRYALVVIIISFVSLLMRSKKYRIVWLALLVPSLFLLAQTQSRTSLLGLAVAGLLFVLIRGLDPRFLIVGPVVSYIIYTSGILYRAHGRFSSLVSLTGRAYTWRRGLAQVKLSPIFGWGFHADRILLQSEHMHNSYLHAAIHAGFVGAILFSCAVISLWYFVFRSGILKKIRNAHSREQANFMESIMILGFLTARSFFESTGAFYGVDLLLMVPAMAYVSYVIEHQPEAESAVAPVVKGPSQVAVPSFSRRNSQ